MSAAPQQEDLTPAGHARAVARQARALELETTDHNPFRNGIRRDHELAAMIAQLADTVTELAATQARIDREDDRLPEQPDDQHPRDISDQEAQRILWAGQDLGFITEPDPLDEDDHRPRHDRHGGHWKWRRADLWCDGACRCIGGAWKLPELAGRFGPLTFCDCDDAATIEAENGATD